MPGFPELIVILIILFIVFGARNMPLHGEKIGRWIAHSRKQQNLIERNEITLHSNPAHPEDNFQSSNSSRNSDHNETPPQ